MSVIRSSSQSRRESDGMSCNRQRARVWGRAKLSPIPRPSAPRPDAVLHFAERRQEEEDQRDQQNVDDEGLDEDEAQDQRAADVAGRARVARDRLGSGG